MPLADTRMAEPMTELSTESRIVGRLREAGYQGVDDRRLSDLAGFVNLLTKWNRKINLTSLDIDPLTDHAIDKLIVEPVVASQFVRNSPKRAIDLGSGGGSPAIPFRIQVDCSDFRLVESRSKKCVFLREAVRTAALAQTFVEEARFEELYARQHLGGRFDLLTIRAVRIDEELISLFRFLLSSEAFIFRFGSAGEPSASSELEIVDVHQLVPSIGSELQILRLSTR